MEETRIQKCSCGNNITVREAFVDLYHDRGLMIIKCDVCSLVSYIHIYEPDASDVTKGAEKIDVWDLDSRTLEGFKAKYPHLPELKPGILLYGDINKFEPEFDLTAPHLYCCEDCGTEVETAASDSFDSEISGIAAGYNSIYNKAVKSELGDNLLIEVDSACNGCGKSFISYWWTSELTDNGIKNNLKRERFLLIGTDMELIILPGIKSKTDCMKLLEKLLVRWNALFPNTVVISPFVGYQRLPDAKMIDLWKWLKKYLNPENAKLVTRKGTFDGYTKLMSSEGFSFEELMDYGVPDSAVDNYSKKQDFHAKVYMGYSSESGEVLSGSFNLVNGPSMENIYFHKTTFEKIKKEYLDPMKLEFSEPGLVPENWAFIKKNSSGQWSADYLEFSDVKGKLLK